MVRYANWAKRPPTWRRNISTFRGVVKKRPQRPKNPSVTTLVSINSGANQQGHILIFQALAANHIPGVNTWPNAAVIVLTSQDIIAMLNGLLGAGVVNSTNFTGIKISSEHSEIPMAIFYRAAPGQHHQVVSNMSRVKFAKRFNTDPNTKKGILPDRIVLASAVYTSFKIRLYYQPATLKTLG